MQFFSIFASFHKGSINSGDLYTREIFIEAENYIDAFDQAKSELFRLRLNLDLFDDLIIQRHLDEEP